MREDAAPFIQVGRFKVLISERDRIRLSAMRWAVTRNYVRLAHKPHTPMHRIIMGDTLVDHIDGNPLNNMRENLRVATPAENSRNRRKRSRAQTSFFKGVTLYDHRGPPRWRAAIARGGSVKVLGFFQSEHAAARAYDAAAREMHGAFACTNQDQALFEKHKDRTPERGRVDPDIDKPEEIYREELRSHVQMSRAYATKRRV